MSRRRNHEPHERIQSAIRSILGSSTKIALAVTGGGVRSISDLTTVAGASATVLEAFVPYCNASLEKFLGSPVSGACNPRTAKLLAMEAYRRGCRLETTGGRILGISATCALTTNRPKRSGHRCHVASWDGKILRLASLSLTRDARSRVEEEEVARRLILETLARSVGASRSELCRSLLLANEKITRTSARVTDPIVELLEGRRQFVTCHPDGRFLRRKPPSGPIFPGAFNPVHDGHLEMASIAKARLGRPVVFELSVRNVDKDSLDRNDVYRRLDALFQTTSRPELILLTNAPTFLEKASLFPGRVFLVGEDTAERILDPRYHGGASGRDRTLARIRRCRCRFLVAGRLRKGRFRTAGDLMIPPGNENLFEEIPEDEFRVDLSSTELRRRLRPKSLDVGGPKRKRQRPPKTP